MLAIAPSLVLCASAKLQVPMTSQTLAAPAIGGLLGPHAVAACLA